jgi:hypothetical protein
MSTESLNNDQRKHRDPVAEYVEFKPHGDGYAVKASGFDPFVVALLKKLPRNERKYVAEFKYWQLTSDATEFAANVLRRCGYDVRGI